MYEDTGTSKISEEDLDSKVYKQMWKINSLISSISIVLSYGLFFAEKKAELENQTNPWEWAKIIPTILGVIGQIFTNIFFLKANTIGENDLSSDDKKNIIWREYCIRHTKYC